MAVMALSHFAGTPKPPSEAELAAALGKAMPVWRELIRRVEERFSLTTEWSHSTKTIGWGMRLKHGERMILSMIPRDGCFLASFALGEKAVARLRDGKLPAKVVAAIDAAPKYAEGRGVRIEVRSARELAAIETIAGEKLAT